MANTLVVYFSATGNTREAARTLADAIGAGLEEIVPAEPYTAADLNWRNARSRVCLEHEDRSMRPALARDPSPEGYDEIFLGYPLWWETAPRLVRTWLEGHDLSGKRLTTFATSSMSLRGTDGAQLHDSAPDADWVDGRRVAANVGAREVRTWANSVSRA
ncbi:flavodoxin [Bifidobacterium pseudolongum]|uniref:flavodoxin n=1 Tax=Bifidobacterium pseudolongum TaxID=1694 RepID=UPI001020F832|nr:flavodoxin [Bifidobacterium pseudolongum]RYQ64022.1 flavodoxin [Bifidobacterium pseudolongum subsp. globosum]